MIPDSCFSDQELKVLSFVPDHYRQECADCMYYLRQGMSGSGVEYCCTQVQATDHECVLFVFPTSDCSIPAFVRLLEQAVEKEASVWNHFPGRVEVAVEFESDRDWTAPRDEFWKRDTWKKIAANPDSLPLALGIGMDGEDQVLDLAKLSSLVILGGDNLDHEELLQNLLAPLCSLRNRSSVETYFMAMNGISMRDCQKFENAAKGIPYANSLSADDKAAAWARHVTSICRDLQAEISRREKMIKDSEFYTFDEYNRLSKDSLPKILAIIVDPPFEYGEGENSVAICEMEKAVWDLYYKCGPKSGVHMIICDYLPIGTSPISSLYQYTVAGRDPEVRVGCLTHNVNRVVALDSHDYYRYCGGPESARAVGKTWIYRSPENEVYKIHQIGE